MWSRFAHTRQSITRPRGAPGAAAPAFWSRAILLIVLAGFWGLLIASVRDKSATADEILHATGGYSFWKFNDYRIQFENSGNGNLPQRWFALPLLNEKYRFPPDSTPAWREGNGFQVGDLWFHRMGNDAITMLAHGRAMAALMAVLVAALVWSCSRHLFGECGAWLSLLLCVLNPAILANGPLMTSDLTAAFFFLAAIWAWWSMLHVLTWARVALSSLALAGLFVSKMSAPVIMPCLVILTAAWGLAGQPGQLAPGEPPARRKSRQLVILAGAALVHVAIVYLTIWGFYGFRYSACADRLSASTTAVQLWAGLEKKSLVDAVDELALPSPTMKAVRAIVDTYAVSLDSSAEATAQAVGEIKRALLNPAQGRELDDRLATSALLAPTARMILWARAHEILPEGYLLAYMHMWHHSRTRRGFLNGEFSGYGRGWFFPFTFLVKTPLATFGVLALGLAAAIAGFWRGWLGKRRGWVTGYRTLPLWTLLGAYWAVALVTRLNIGHRHILPVYPPLFVLAGAAAAWFSNWRSPGAVRPLRWAGVAGVAVLALVGIQAVEVACRFPHYLAYFNGIVTPRQAYRHVVDSSLDWGQDLPGVRRYRDGHATGGPFYLSYFGAGDPATYGIHARYLPSSPGLFMIDRPPILWKTVNQTDPVDSLDAVLRSLPEYESLGVDSSADPPRALLVKTSQAFRLTAGSYLIAATMLQNHWDARAEATYQKLRGVVEPFLASDIETRRANIVRAGAERWREALQSWETARFARLTAFLRQREPTDNIGFSILVYKLSETDIATALDAPVLPPHRE